MYQVFINQSSITFQQQMENENLFSAYNNLYVSKVSQVLSIFNRLENVHKSTDLILHIDNLDALWEELLKTITVVEAAGGIVNNEMGELLFILRNGKWDLPKGKVENGEAISVAAVREVEEECGVNNVTLGAALPTTYHIYWLNGELILKPTYWYSMSLSGNQKLVPQTEEGIVEVKWVNSEHLGPIFDNTYASIAHLLRQVV